MKLVVGALMVVMLVFAASIDQAQAQQNIEKIIGQNDLLAVNAEATNIPFKFKKLVNAFGKLGMGCTATHIGKGYVLTAGHCFWASDEPMRDMNCEASENDIEWGYREGKTPYMVSKCQKIIIAQTTDEMDYALLKVYPFPDTAVTPDMDLKAKVGDRVTIFSHPEELPLRWSRFCRVQKTYASEFPLELIHHVCDTNPGSSGATIINVETNKVIGIHDGGRARNGIGYNYGTYLYDTPVLKILKSLGFK